MKTQIILASLLAALIATPVFAAEDAGKAAPAGKDMKMEKMEKEKMEKEKMDGDHAKPMKKHKRAKKHKKEMEKEAK